MKGVSEMGPNNELASKVYDKAYGTGRGEGHEIEKCAQIEEWLDHGDLGDSPAVDELAAEWIEGGGFFNT
jgi:hypothetical protein